MFETDETANPCVPAPSIEDVEGVVEHSNLATSSFRLRLTDGSTAYLSWYEIGDDAYLACDIGSVLRARVDRREKSAGGAGEHFVLGAPAHLLLP